MSVILSKEDYDTLREIGFDENMQILNAAHVFSYKLLQRIKVIEEKLGIS